MADMQEIKDMLEAVDPAGLTYVEWLNVGMALHSEGVPSSVYDQWSARDVRRYKPDDAESKYQSFRGAVGSDITIATLAAMAIERGWTPPRQGYALDYDSVIQKSQPGDYQIIDPAYIGTQGVTLKEPDTDTWDQAGEMIRYLQLVYEPEEYVSLVVDAFQKEGSTKWEPANGGRCGRTAGDLIKALEKRRHDPSMVFGDFNPEAGAWIRPNPVNGEGNTEDHITSFRWCLVESDTLEIEKQEAIIRELELPAAVVVHSGGKSLHAIVRVDAADKTEYRKRVDYIYSICEKNGLEIDISDKNSGRLSRLPGVYRSGKKQYIVAEQIGKKTYQEWYEWVERTNDNLPDPVRLTDVWGNIPPLADELISGVLRTGQKMLLAGPSKAGKSFALIQLCAAIAEGGKWLGQWKCRQGKVLYVNLELAEATCFNRFQDVYETLGITDPHLENVTIWNLRGEAMPMDQLAPKLIWRAAKEDYIAVIIDPIYKVLTGDENSAEAMSKFSNQFDIIAKQLGTAVIYCHHFTKGAQAGKRQADRPSGSSVFVRDPDSMITMSELAPTDAMRGIAVANAVTAFWRETLAKCLGESYADDIKDDRVLYDKLGIVSYAASRLDRKAMDAARSEAYALEEKELAMSAWLVEGTLREFPTFAPLRVWFDYPTHRLDGGELADAKLDGDEKLWEKGKKAVEEKKENAAAGLQKYLDDCFADEDEPWAEVKDLATEFAVSKNTIKNRLKEIDGIKVTYGVVHSDDIAIEVTPLGRGQNEIRKVLDDEDF